jgi:mono/diheme cytochrome c family protein
MLLAFVVRVVSRSVVLATLLPAVSIGQEPPPKSFAELKIEGAQGSRYRVREASAADATADATALTPNLDTFHREIEPILADACYRCHGPERRKADLRVDELDPDLFGGKDVETWLEVLAVLNNKEMPPDDDDVHLGDDQRREIVEWLVAESQRASLSRRGNARTSSLRRLARYEFSYLLQDLLALPIDLADDLPPDPVSHDGFENSAEVLQVSGVQFRAWHDAAERALDLATVAGPRPTVLQWSVPMQKLADREWQKQSAELAEARKQHPEGSAELAAALAELDKRHRRRVRGAHFLDPTTERRAAQSWNYDGARYASTPTESASDSIREVHGADLAATTIAVLPPRAAFTLELGDRIPDRGALRVRVRAWFRGGDLPAPSIRLHFGWQASNDSRADFVVGDSQVVAASPDSPRIYEWNVPLPALYPRNAVRGVNRMGDLPSPSELIRLVNESHTESDLFIDQVEVTAPVYATWPPASHAAIFGDDGDDGDAGDAATDARHEVVRAREILRRFLPRAWRRSVSDDEVARKLRLFERLRRTSDGFAEAVRRTLATVLSAPDAVFVGTEPEGADDTPSRVSAFGLATRLSLFLWCSGPDEDLLALAEQGRLAEPAILREQVERMLDSPKAARFPREFVRQWLNLSLLDFLNVDPERHPSFDDDLQRAMREEPVEFFAELLRRDLSVLELLHSDFAMVNERLARHYGIDDVTGGAFRRVALAADTPRGGLLTQAGLLAMNSDGKDSHPLKRGVWLLERLLDDPPPPPPAAVPVIDLADPRIAKMTLKQRLEDHRNAPACMACHARIDPWGVAFEHFDAIGNWRTEIGGQPVDASARLFNQQPIDGTDGLKRFLLQHRQDQFVRALVKKLATYALGRPLTFADRAALDQITATVRRDGDGLRAIVHHLAASELFHGR